MNDSFESIISDARLNSCTYAHRRGNGPVNRTDQDGNTSAIFLLLDECADVIQAVSNLVAALNVVDFAPYMDDCRERNEERGRL